MLMTFRRACCFLMLATLFALCSLQWGEPDLVIAQSKTKMKKKEVFSDNPDPKGAWLGFANGRGPTLMVYYDNDQWHVRCTGKKDEKSSFTGQIQIIDGKLAGGNIQGLDKAKNVRMADWLSLSPDRKTINLKFANGGDTDGFDFSVTPETTKIKFVNFATNGNDAPRTIRIGRKGEHPNSATFELPAKPE